MVIELESEQQFETLLKENKKVLVDIGATWCGPCRMLKPVLEDVSETLTDVCFISVDVDKFQHIGAKYGVRSVPTLVLVENNETKKITVGYQTETGLTDFILN